MRRLDQVWIVIGLTVSLCVTSVNAQSVILNEIMASNSGVVEVESGLSPDWIELRNTSSRTVNLSGMYLSDDPDNLTKWAFPSGTSIKAKKYLVVWADDTLPTSLLHTNFSLRGDGEDLISGR